MAHSPKNSPPPTKSCPKKTPKPPPNTLKPLGQDNDSQTQEQAQDHQPVHSPITSWVYQTENSNLTIHEKLEKDRWECGSGNAGEKYEARL